MFQTSSLWGIALLVFLLATACGDGDPAEVPAGTTAELGAIVDMGAQPAPLNLGDVPALMTPPAGRWRHRAASQAAGQWYSEYLSEDGGTLMRAFVFPTQQSRDPVAVLMQAVDTFFRSVGVEGFGLPSRKAHAVWGAPAADALLSAAVGGRRVDGAVRLLLVGPENWALAIGYAPADGSAGAQEAVQRFAKSLEPREPHFFQRGFHSDAKFAATALNPAGEAVLVGRDLAAVLLLLEAGAGRRVPLASRPVLVKALVAEARALTKAGRDGYREAAPGFSRWASLPAEERAAGMRALGARMLQALHVRANEGDPAAISFARLWHTLGAVGIGTAEEGLSVGALSSLNEMSAFLAEVAGDKAIRGAGDAGRALQAELRADLTQRWAGLAAEEKQALGRSGAQWAELRRAWDQATPADRAAFRRATVAELAHPDERETVSALAPGRPLMRWIEARTAREPEALERDALLVRRAFQLTASQRDELIGLLAVEARPFALGW